MASANHEAVLHASITSSTLCQDDRDSFSTWLITSKALLQQPLDLDGMVDLLSTIPVFPEFGHLSIAALSYILSQSQGVLPTLDIIRCYTRFWSLLPESFKAKAGLDEPSTPILQAARDLVCLSVGTLRSHFVSTADKPALINPETHETLTHQQLSEFIHSFTLPLSPVNIPSQATVAIALPQGYLVALACLAVASYYTAAPLNITGGEYQFRKEVELAGAQCVLVLATDVERLGLQKSWVTEAGIQIILVTPMADMTFQVRPCSAFSPETQASAPTPNSGNDLAMILFTSGTSGKRKVVPITCLGLLTGVQCVIDSWHLSPSDSCVNMMPLNHVGGIVRNLFAPVLSGGSTILCQAFDPNLFWDLLESGQGTWYYASPSVHMSILAEANIRGESVKNCQLRLVCNAAGGLLPALALRLKDAFRCTVLPSYGMTECMPISTPPLNYTLDRIGTSGTACGPEIAILDDSGKRLTTGEIGRINVRAGPTFPGYLLNGKIDRSSFTSDGWFDTGDLGTLDKDGYLYLTGRGKEVINRGGEIISPFEVEEAITIASQSPKSPLFGRIIQCMAFSAPHEVLQEVVGVALVVGDGHPRPDIRDLHSALNSLLNSTKLPVVLVYMKALPMSNNKLVRIGFAERMSMEPVTNCTALPARHFEATCPPLNSTLSTKISNSTCEFDLSILLSQLQKFLGPELQGHVGVSFHDGTPMAYLAPREIVSGQQTLVEGTIEDLETKLREALDGLLVPSGIYFLPTPYPRLRNGAIDESTLQTMLTQLKNTTDSPAASKTEQSIRKAFAEVLNFPIDEIKAKSDFFALGGESLSAGKLLSVIRRDIGIRIPIEKLFKSPTVFSLCQLVDNIQSNAENANINLDAGPSSMARCTMTYSSTNPFVLIVHALPIMLFYPMKMAFQWTALMYALSTLSQDWYETNVAARFLALITAIFASRLATQIIAPLLGVGFKWLVIGKYREGVYPMWGPYHTRWWIVDKVLRICGKGHFRHLDSTRILYLRLLGARLGKGVTVEKGTVLGEYDLLNIGDNVHLDRCICRPFATERNTSMYLGPIIIGSDSSIGLKSHVAAGSTLPPDTFIGPNSSSYEVDTRDNSDRSPTPNSNPWIQIFLILPIQVLIMFISALPWMGGLIGIVINQPKDAVDSVRTIITWWATPHRIEYHYLAQALNVAVRPFVWFSLLVLTKFLLNIVCGRAVPKTAEARTSRDRFRKQLLNALTPHGSVKSLTKLLGTHYETTSMVVRAMGGKVGKRVYWPGTGPSIEDFDLIDIGDDVVFGSRSHLITSDASGGDMIRIGNGAMIADRVVISRGAEIGQRTVLGSGTFIKRHQTCVPDSIWVGNRKGNAVCLSNSETSTITISDTGDDVEKGGKSYALSSTEISVSTPSPSYPGSLHSQKKSNFAEEIFQVEPSSKVTANSISGSSSTAESDAKELPPTPFGRAFYARKAPYYVFNQFTIFCYSTFITIFVRIYWNVATISTVIFYQIIRGTDQFHPRWYRPLKVYALDVCIVSGLCICLSLLALGICIVAKWVLLGRRKPGSYDWDKSSYCQRWQLFLTIEAVRRRCFGGDGVLGMLTGTYYIALYFRLQGAKIGKDVALFAGGRPSLVFTEPDLLKLGDRVSVDDASLVGHINSRGRFSLNTLEVGDRSVLRSGSRLLSGAKMGSDSVLLEHTLIMAGDEADDGAVYQGWPAERFD